MSRKSAGSTPSHLVTSRTVQWTSIVISWVNLFEKETLTKISDLKSSKFFTDTIVAIFEFNGMKDVSFKNSNDLAIKFIKEYFPEIIKEKYFNLKNDDDILVLASLLMYKTCIKCKIEDFVSKTCGIKLNDNLQEEAMKTFFEQMLTIADGNFTRRTIMNTIQNSFDPITVTGARKSLSPSASRSCLKEFLGSPLLQEKFLKNKEENDIKHLNRLLQEENSELLSDKETLAKKNEELEASINKLQTHLHEKSKEINFLKEELCQYENREFTDKSSNNNAKCINEEIDQIKIDLKEVQSLNENLLLENEKYVKQIKDLEVEFKKREDDFIEKIKIIGELEEKLDDIESKNISLYSENEELRRIIEQYKEERSPKEELDMSTPRVEENIGLVLKDLELREKEETINKLQDKLKSLELLCKEKDFKCATIEKILIENDLTIKSLRKEVKQQSITVGIMNQNCIELSEKLKEVKLKNDEHIKVLEENILLEEQRNKQLAENLNLYEISEKKLQVELQSKCLEIENANSSLNDVHNQIKAKELEIESLKNVVKELNENSKIVEDRFMSRLAEFNETSEHLKESQRIVNQLNITVAEKDLYIHQMETLLQTSTDDKRDLLLKISHQTEQIKQHEMSEKKLKNELQSKCLEVENTTSTLKCLKSNIKVNEAELKTLNSQLKKLTTKNEIMQNNLSASLAENKELEDQLADSLKTVAQLNTTVEDREFQIDQFKTLIQTLSEELKESQLKNAHQSGEIKQLEISKKELEGKLQSKSCELEDLTQALSGFNLQVNDLLANNISLDKELSEALAKTQQLEKEMYESKEELRHNIAQKESHITELESVINGLKENEREMETHIEDQESKIKQLEMSNMELVSKLQEQVEGLSAKNITLDKELSVTLARTQQLEKEMFESNEHLKHDIAEKDSQMAQLQEVINVLKVNKREMETHIDDQEGKIKQLEMSNMELETKLQEQVKVSAKNVVIEEELSVALAKTQQLEKEMYESKEQLRHNIAEKESLITELEVAINALKENERGMKSHIEDQESKMKQLEISNMELENKLQEKIEGLSAKNISLDKDLSVALAKTKQLEKEMFEANEQLKHDIAEKDSQMAQLQAVIDALESEKSKIETQLKDEVTSLKAKITNFETEIETKEAECLVLHKEVARFNCLLSSLQAEYDVTDAKNKELASELSSVTASASHLENIIQEDNFKIDHLESIINKLESVSQKQDGDNKNLMEEISNLEKVVDELRKFATDKETDVKNLQVQLNTSNGEIDKLKEEVLKLVSEKEQLIDTFKQVDDKIAVKQKVVEDLQNENLKLKKQLENHDPQLKEAYDKLFDDYHRLNSENDEMKAQLENVRASVRAEYEEILKKMKSHMKLSCTRAIEMKEEKHAKAQKELQQVVIANQEHITQLSTSLWDTSDKLLITKNQNEELKKEVAELRKALSAYKGAPDSLQRTRSYEHMSLPHQKALQMVEEETVTVSRRQSLRTVPSGIGKVFPSEDEAEEMFNNDNLADLKAGRCQVPAGDPDRVSTLMYRNSLCPPHLKSSYPAETQFLPIDTLHEDDIKGRTLGDDAKLLPEKRRKDRSQGMELRNVSTPRSALRELPNDENKKPATPSRLFSHIFSARQRNSVARNENVQSTPDRRRLSFFNRHFVKKEPSE